MQIDHPIPESVTQSLADKPEIYQKFFIRAAQRIFDGYIANQELADILIEANNFDSETFPQFRFDLARVTRKEEKRLKDIHGCMEAAEKGNWRDRDMSLGHHEKLNQRLLADDEKARFMLEAKTEDLSCKELAERVEDYLVTHKGKVKKERDDPLFELNERIEHIEDRLKEAAVLLKECRGYVEEYLNAEMVERIDDWLRAE